MIRLDWLLRLSLKPQQQLKILIVGFKKMKKYHFTKNCAKYL
jgi:hypothetical protein